ncbi:RNA-directed DNA polymerase, eukaryota, reverse transcriptase zinc-binding domain protein [Tanacetum coccineum]|uniref:RNA-directed DNA polymerase, eukaryota, reverse transcriptase zinc-binding domain protein n=1 Tax=Tanacetum coccineum TaxID=301880 RepID=A0ABQ5AW39_9ASTR
MILASWPSQAAIEEQTVVIRVIPTKEVEGQLLEGEKHVLSKTVILRLPTRVNIDRRGIDIDSIRCPICDEDLESEDYLFVSCVIAVEIWKNILDWWGISNVGIKNLYDVINLADRVPLEPKHSNFFDMVVQTAIWSI